MKFFLLSIFLSITMSASTQAKLVINGGVINISNGASVVVDNPDNMAITQTGLGYIQSEGSSNRIIWTIGGGNGNTYVVPFGNAANYLPLRFNAASGAGTSGQIVFSTYPTPTWKNSDFLPPGVTGLNAGAVDNSAKVIDRFWQITPLGYTTKPTLTSLRFTYSDGEYAAPNTLTEANLFAQRWNSIIPGWADYVPASVVNTAANTVDVPTVPGNQLYNWWTLVDRTAPLPVRLLNFTANVNNKKVVTTWQTATELATSHFEIWRSRDARQFDFVGRVTAASRSATTQSYTLTDPLPYSGISFYRLKMVDLDSSFVWSPTVRVMISDRYTVLLYPNPASAFIGISVAPELAVRHPMVFLYAADGRLVQRFSINATYHEVNLNGLAAGAYRINITDGTNTQTLSFIKK